MKDAKYTNIKDFNEDGIAVVELDNKFGYITKEFNELAPCIYDKAYDFHDKYGLVKLNNNFMFIDINGNKIPCICKLIPYQCPENSLLRIYYSKDKKIMYFQNKEFIGNINEFRDYAQKCLKACINTYFEWMTIIKNNQH